MRSRRRSKRPRAPRGVDVTRPVGTYWLIPRRRGGARFVRESNPLPPAETSARGGRARGGGSGVVRRPEARRSPRRSHPRARARRQDLRVHLGGEVRKLWLVSIVPTACPAHPPRHQADAAWFTRVDGVDRLKSPSRLLLGGRPTRKMEGGEESIYRLPGGGMGVAGRRAPPTRPVARRSGAGLKVSMATAGFRMWKLHIKVSSMDMMAPALSNSPQ